MTKEYTATIGDLKILIKRQENQIERTKNERLSDQRKMLEQTSTNQSETADLKRELKKCNKMYKELEERLFEAEESKQFSQKMKQAFNQDRRAFD